MSQQLPGSAEAASLAVSSVDVASMPWAFTKHRPLGTCDFIKEAGRRGVRLDLLILRELYRRKVLEPFVYVNNRQVGPVGMDP